MARVTIVLDDLKEKKLRIIQARHIARDGKAFSFSRIIDMVLEEGLKKVK